MSKTSEVHRLSRDLDILQYPIFKAQYCLDPAGFVTDCIEFPEGEGPKDYQLETLAELIKYWREAVRGPHGLGKTGVAAWAVLWFGLTRDGKDWKTPTTASVNRQLKEYLWPEIHKWARRIRWRKVGRLPFREGVELQTMALKLKTGSAFAVASDQPSAIEGAHGDSMLFIYDEAKTIPESMFDATEGAFSGAGPDTGREAFALAFSTPGAPSGRFYAIHARRPGLTDWHAKHVTLEDAIRAGRVSRDWAEKRAQQWGRTSPIYRTRVLGEFAADQDAVIPLEWVEAANERWRGLCADLGLTEETFRLEGDLTALGVDVADGGRDDTVLARRVGWVIEGLSRYAQGDPMVTTGRVSPVLKARGGVPVIDVIGVGSGVVARLRELGFEVIAFNAAEKTDFTDRSGELEFGNKRAAAWWNMRELLDPDNGEPIALPPDDMLLSDLSTPRVLPPKSGGKIFIESKDDIAKRLGRSTDAGDAVVQAFALEILREKKLDLGGLAIGGPTRSSPWRM